MTTPSFRKLHEGEKTVQRRRHTPKELARDIPSYIHSDMPQPLAGFYSGLSYLPLGTMDEHGRPWASILVTESDSDPSVGIRILEGGVLSLTAQMSPHDPFFRAASQTKGGIAARDRLFAGVGVDFANRRRNKVAGAIDSANLDVQGKVQLRLTTNEHLGNCPKYITVRSLVPHYRKSELALDHFDSLSEPLPEECKDVINHASTVFLATRHVPRDDSEPYMGFNHRGGSPGFVRFYEETALADKSADNEPSSGDVSTYLVLPDYSGNRFYQTLGNIQSSELVGLAFPDFSTGHILYVTGKAENLFDEDAEVLMPRMKLVTRIRVTGAVFIKEAMNLRLESEEQFSPYNPPVRYLRHELEAMGRTHDAGEVAADPTTATLVSVRALSSTVSTFSFRLPRSVESPPPGGFGIFDFSQLLDAGYSHMNEANPQAVNEDYVRTWTLSSAPEFAPATRRFEPLASVEVTVKHQPNGLISSFLHRQSTPISDEDAPTLQVTLKGTGGGFSCFNLGEAGPLVPAKMLWVAGGVGITPFMSMWDAIRRIHRSSSEHHSMLSTDIVLVFSGRDDDLNLLQPFLADAESVRPSVSLRVVAYQTVGDRRVEASAARNSLTEDFPHSVLSVHQRRLDPSDLMSIDNLFEREVFLCGPDGLIRTTQEWLQSKATGSQRVHQESFLF